MPTPAIPELPRLERGLNRLVTDAETPAALHSLVCDHVLTTHGSACWIDARNNATTHPLLRIAPDRRILDRIHVGRAFTAFQHYSLLEELEATLREDTTLLVCPAVDWFYRDDDLLRGEGASMLTDALALVQDAVEAYDLPVLYTCTHPDGVGEPVVQATDRTIECRSTAMGPRFRTEGFETLVYPDAGGLQTTLAFWERVLAARHPDAGAVSQPAARGGRDRSGIARGGSEGRRIAQSGVGRSGIAQGETDRGGAEPGGRVREVTTGGAD